MSHEKQYNEAKRWILQAEDDLSSAEILNKNDKYAQACFLCQQAGEKAIKALWYFLGNDPWGHSIYKLIEELPVQHIRADFLKLLEHAQTLDKLYIPTRYPNGLPDITPKDAYSASDYKSAFNSANILIKEVKDLF